MKMRSPAKSARLMLVYNADAGLLNAARESLLKMFTPSKVACSLCALTHGIFVMHGDWRMFLNSLPLIIDEYHRDEVAEAFPDLEIALPAILVATDGAKPGVLIATHELDAMADLDELIERVQDRLVELLSRSPGLRLTD